MDFPPRLLDTRGRPLRNLRVSVTDRCNLRCSYCMPGEDYVWLPREDILRFEEMALLVDAFVSLGVDRVRLTGGEPLLRQGLETLIEMLGNKPGLRDIALTTNGLRLVEQAAMLKEAGLHRLTISLDSLVPGRFRRLTRRDELPRVLAGIDAANAVGFENTKVNAVVIRGFNDDELVPLVEFARAHGLEMRFIEYMDVGGAAHWDLKDVVTRSEMIATLSDHFGEVRPLAPPADDDERSVARSAPANRYVLPDGTVIGIVASTTAPFCGDCNRSRLTADGMWFRCLYAIEGTGLRKPLRAGATREELAERIASQWQLRTDRAAEERHDEREGGASPAPVDSQHNPHLEMHKRGG